MKNLSAIILTLLSMVLFSLSGYSQGKIGHLNSEEVIQAMPETDSINKILNALQADYRKLAEELEVQYNNVVEEYSSQYESLKPMERKLKESEIGDLQKRIQTFSTESQNEYVKQRQDLFSPVYEKARKAIEEVGKANGFQYIIDSSQGILLLLPEDESLNLLPRVKQKLGIG